ncbi:MAG: methyltransferase domain-containing protein [Endomicrobiia bacterium]
MKKLNLGCGKDIKQGWINLDIVKLDGVDIVYDINKLPLPFAENEFDYILCKDVLEHFDNYVLLLKDLHRILKVGGVLEISVPHFSSRDNYVDPTHKRMFSFETFKFFTKNGIYGFDYYFDFTFSELVFSKITFRKKFYLLNYILEPFTNCCEIMKKLYELTFLCWIFPAWNIVVKLKK